MKGHLLALFTACSLAVSLVVTSPVIAFAANDDIYEVGGLDGEEVYVRDEKGEQTDTISETEIGIQAKVNGDSDKIIYSIYLEYGEMKFEYDFGQTWDPETHKYSSAASGKSTGGWVTKKYIDGVNNYIFVQNDSNYPIHVDITHTIEGGSTKTSTVFNSNSTGAGAVIGIFSDDNDELKNNINTDDYCGQKSAIAPNKTKISFDLDMDYSQLENDDADYHVLKLDHAHSKTITHTVFFSLCGRPDSSTTLTSSFSDVGKIKITIKPVAYADTVKRPTK